MGWNNLIYKFYQKSEIQTTLPTFQQVILKLIKHKTCSQRDFFYLIHIYFFKKAKTLKKINPSGLKFGLGSTQTEFSPK